jgi:hypothetical protein
MVIAMFALAPGQAWAQAAIVRVPGTTTRDIPFTSHDGYPMLGRLTLPDTPRRPNKCACSSGRRRPGYAAIVEFMKQVKR